jgi:hypothetical protein
MRCPWLRIYSVIEPKREISGYFRRRGHGLNDRLEAYPALLFGVPSDVPTLADRAFLDPSRPDNRSLSLNSL